MINRLLNIILISMFLVTSVYAQNVPANPLQPLPSDIIFVLDNFSTMLNGHSNPYNITHGEATDAYNVRVNDQYNSIGKRLPLNLIGTCGHTSSVTGLYRYYKSNGTSDTVTSSGQYLDYISDSGSCTNLLSGQSSGKRWNFVTYKDLLIATNGYDQPQKWDGILTTTSDTTGARSPAFLTTQLGAPFTQLALGAGLTASKWYQYLIVFYDGTNYWYSLSRSNPLQIGAVNNKQVLVNGVPLGPLTTTKRYIYRTLGDNTASAVQADTTYYLDKILNDNSTTSFTDSTTDAAISAAGGAIPTWATVTAGGLIVTPPHGIYPFINGEYVWLANDPSGVQYGQSTAYFSSVGNPDYYLSTNFFLIRPDDGDAITFINSFLGVLTIGKTNSISKIYTSNASSSNWSISQPFSFIGCIAPYSVQSTSIGIIYLGRYGLFQFNGQSSSLISDSVTNEIRDINQIYYNNIVSIFYNNEFRMAYVSQQSGSSTNNRVLLFDSIRNSYIKDTENINAWAIYNSASDFGGLYSGSSTTDGNILAHSTTPKQLIVRSKNDLNAGTFSSSYALGTDDFPILSLGSGSWASDASAWNADASTWIADSSPGTWISAISQINSSALSTLSWNSILPAGTTATIAIRTGATIGAVNVAAWSSEFSNPAGSDISGVTPNVYIQMRVTLSTDSLTYTPQLLVQDNFMIKLIYSQNGTTSESSVSSSWVSGWLDLVTSANTFYMSNMPKIIKEIDVYYTGTSGTMNFNIQNLKGDSNASFNIDLSQNRLATQSYWGNGIYKMYRWMPNFNGGNNSPLTGDKFIVSISENGTKSWRVQRIAIRYDLQNYRPYTAT